MDSRASLHGGETAFKIGDSPKQIAVVHERTE